MKTMKKFKMRLGKIALLLGVMMTFSATAFAHCDSYDGPVIQDAYKALEMKDATYVMKWIAPEHEAEIKQLFGKTIDLKNGDAKIYSIVEKHFFGNPRPVSPGNRRCTIYRLKTGRFHCSNRTNG